MKPERITSEDLAMIKDRVKELRKQKGKIAIGSILHDLDKYDQDLFRITFNNYKVSNLFRALKIRDCSMYYSEMMRGKKVFKTNGYYKIIQALGL